MRVLVVYDTVSDSKMTRQVAENITETLKEKGVDVASSYVKDVDTTVINDYDCLIVGAPTMAFRPSREIMKFLNDFAEGSFSGKQAAAFDTQLKMRINGNAAKGIEKKLKNLGFNIFKEPLIVYVESKEKLWHFKSGELEKGKTWAQEAAKALS